MTAADVLEIIESQGYRLTPEGGNIRIAPVPTDDVRTLIRAHKADLVALLQPDTSDWPAELVRFIDIDATELPGRLAACEDCGGPLEVHRLYRCDRCILIDFRRQQAGTQ